MSEVLAAVWVPGVPRTKGSLDARMQDTPQSKRWRQLVAAELVRDGYLRRPGAKIGRPAGHAGPVAVRCVFVRADGKGDVDKLARCVLDALTDSRVIADDVQVIKLSCERVTAGGRGDGAFVLVATVDDDPTKWAGVAGEIFSWVPLSSGG
jgi:Holliday junction resolvase RusA-like endonuclease